MGNLVAVSDASKLSLYRKVLQIRRPRARISGHGFIMRDIAFCYLVTAAHVGESMARAGLLGETAGGVSFSSIDGRCMGKVQYLMSSAFLLFHSNQGEFDLQAFSIPLKARGGFLATAALLRYSLPVCDEPIDPSQPYSIPLLGPDAKILEFRGKPQALYSGEYAFPIATKKGTSGTPIFNVDGKVIGIIFRGTVPKCGEPAGMTVCMSFASLRILGKIIPFPF